MKPYFFTYHCPHCKKNLQSPNTEDGKSLSCPECLEVFTVPPPPPRPIGGWLSVLAVITVLGWTMLGVIFAGVVAVGIINSPLLALPIIATIGVVLLPGIVLSYGFFKRRKWFVPCQMFSLITAASGNTVVYAVNESIKPDDTFWIRVVCLYAVSGVFILYFWRSKRVKETFTT